MNKTIAFSLAALALAACSEQADFTQADVVNAAVENADMPVRFDTYLGSNSSTRAVEPMTYQGGTIVNGDYDPDAEGGGASQKLKNASFGVFSYYTEENTYSHNSYRANFMYNEHITWSATSPSNVWIYAPVKYWPNGIDAANVDNNNSPSATAVASKDQYLSFFAYAPYATQTTTAYVDGDYTAWGAKPYDADVAPVKTTATAGVVGLTANSALADPWVNYVMKATADGASTVNETGGIDLLWGMRGQLTYDETDNVNNTIDKLGAAYNTNLTKQSTDEKVRFLFKHALAKVGGATQTSTGGTSDPAQGGLKVVLDVDANSTTAGAGADNQAAYQIGGFNEGTGNTGMTLVTIKEVTVSDAFTYYNDKNSDGRWETSDLNTRGWFNLATGLWKNTGHPDGDGDNETKASRTAGGATYKFVADDDDLNTDIKEGTVKNTTGVAWDKTKTSEQDGYTGGASGVTTVAKNVYADKNVPGIFMIPGTTPQTIYVTIDYLVRTADPKLDVKGDQKQRYTEVEQIITNAVKLSNLEANKYYTLVMHLGLTSVKFEAIVADWAGTSNATYDENGNVIDDGTTEQKSVWLPSNVVNTTSITADAGTTHKHVTVDATADTYTVNLTGAGADGTVAFTTTSTAKNLSGTDITTTAGVDVTASNTANASVSVSGGNAAVTIKLKPNYSSTAVVNTVVITRASGESTTVTITQAPRVIVLTPAATTVSDKAEPFIVNATTSNGEPIAWADYDITTTSGTITSDGTQQSAGIIQVTPAANTGSTTQSITVTVTVKDAKVTTNDIAATASTTVTQASAE